MSTPHARPVRKSERDALFGLTKLIRGRVESPLYSGSGSNFAFANRLELVRAYFGIQNRSLVCAPRPEAARAGQR